jgi:PIN domain nuclease of toxin-antitoxin system
MTYLLDTHTVIWFVADHHNLPDKTKEKICDSNSICYASIASYWEIAIKYALGKLSLDIELEHFFKVIEQSGIAILPITASHILANAKLDFHHRDPFDRMIIAQSFVEKIPIITRDNAFSDYPIDVYWEG